MIRLDTEAQKHLGAYLEQVRIHLGGCRSVDPAEVERDVRQHIERELEDVPEPVSFNDLDTVLDRLGSPAQWVPEEEISWWRKMVMRLRTGPEDWRLAYLSFGLLVLGLLSGPALLVLIPASAIVSRAALSFGNGDKELRAQRWLIYPSLIVVYLLLGFGLLFFPVCALFGLADSFEHTDRIQVFPWTTSDDLAYWPIAWMFIAAGTGLWWFLLGCAHRQRPRLLEAVLRPFMEKTGSRIANWLTGLGAAALVIGSVAGALMMKYPAWYATLRSWGG